MYIMIQDDAIKKLKSKIAQLDRNNTHDTKEAASKKVRVTRSPFFCSELSLKTITMNQTLTTKLRQIIDPEGL